MSGVEIRYTTAVDGTRIAYHFIDGHDPVILDSPVFGHQFEPVEAIRSWRDYRGALRGDNAWLLFDYRGFGLSSRLGPKTSIADFQSDFRAVRDTVAGRDLVVVATGAGIGPAVEDVIEHPEGVRGMLLQGTGAEPFPAPLLAALRVDYEEGIFASARLMYDWDSEDAIRPLVKEYMAHVHEEDTWAAIEVASSWESRERLPLLRVPLAIRTAPAERDAAADLVAALRGARLEVDDEGPRLNRRSGQAARDLIAPWLGTPAQRHASALMSPLTARQRDVAQLVAEGRTNAAIAEELSIAPGTVARHVSDILASLNLENRTQIAREAARLGLLGRN